MKKNNIKFDLLIILFLILACYFLYSLISKEKEKYKSKSEVKEFILTTGTNELVDLKTNNNEETNESDTNKNELTLNYYKNKYNNSDIVGILSVKNTKINTLLLQTDNNEYYLRRLPNKKKHVTGSVFIDYRTKLNKDKNVIIYGHNANNYDIPFKYLRYYLKEDFYKNNKYIDIKTDDGKLKYEIFSVFIIKDDNRYLDISFPTLENFSNHLEYLKSKSIYGTSASVSSSDSIITLQTCLLKDNALIIICAKQIL